MSDQGSDFGSYLAGFIVGGLVGAAAALLLAPKSGEETRQVIKEKSIELKDRAALTAEETRARAEQALEDARVRANEAMEEVRVRTEEVSRLARERATDLQQRGQVILEEQRSKIEGAIETGKKAAERVRGDMTQQPPAETPPPAEPPVVPE